MLLADMGADVVRVARLSGDAGASTPSELFSRGKRSVRLDLKEPDGILTLLDVTDRADVLLDAFRPGVAEQLGIGPEVCLARNPRLVYARPTRVGQTGPMVSVA